MLAALGILLLDHSVAELVHATGMEDGSLFELGTALLDFATGKHISKFLLGGLVLLAGLALAVPQRTQLAGRAMLYVGTTQVLATLIVGVAKTWFGRLRPDQLFLATPADVTWFAQGNSFPSGHAAFYFGLMLPLACLFPKWRWPLLAVAWFIAVARIVGNHHFVSDVGASIAFCGLLAWVLLPIAGRPRESTAMRSD
ncbi:MAG: phosphatase PAP2 family protein [Arenimonas sp.]